MCADITIYYRTFRCPPARQHRLFPVLRYPPGHESVAVEYECPTDTLGSRQQTPVGAVVDRGDRTPHDPRYVLSLEYRLAPVSWLLFHLPRFSAYRRNLSSAFLNFLKIIKPYQTPCRKGHYAQESENVGKPEAAQSRSRSGPVGRVAGNPVTLVSTHGATP